MRQIDILENIFTNQITVLNIAMPTNELTLDEAKRKCVENNYDVHLVRNSENDDLRLYERSTNNVRSLLDYEVVSESTPILEVMELLLQYQHVFVKVKRSITLIVSHADLDSIPVRIWLFGMISILEVELRNKIRSSGIDWQKSLSEGRLDKAKNLFALKIERNEEVDILECLQIVDLSLIITKHWNVFKCQFSNINKKLVNKTFTQMRDLRDELAHAQRITLKWDEIYNSMKFTRQWILPQSDTLNSKKIMY